ncbi:MAG: acylphosphatase [Candidatus Euphemobacter frigidus]|nr:acylphosphatase [Candidatus Euphemobacter frigidus]MDP8276567.1 acylphosphatase [Candidatus Euphemobacter frigidus]
MKVKKRELYRRIHILVSGRVQGVFFRYDIRRHAEEFGLTGYVTNLYDGRVEIVAEGEEAKLRRLLAWARHGPPGAVVTGVELRWESPKNSFPSFGIR